MRVVRFNGVIGDGKEETGFSKMLNGSVECVIVSTDGNLSSVSLSAYNTDVLRVDSVTGDKSFFPRAPVIMGGRVTDLGAKFVLVGEPLSFRVVGGMGMSYDVRVILSG